MSETGAGSIRDLRTRLLWLARSADIDAHPTAAGRWARDVSALAHAELDWAHDRWSVTPPTIVRLPAADGTAVLTGSRRTGTLDRLQETDIAVIERAPTPAERDLPAPTTILIQFDSPSSLAVAAQDIGARYVGCTALMLAERLPQATLGTPAAPPAVGNDTLERLVDGDRVTFEKVSARLDDGLYRLQRQGRMQHLCRRAGSWYLTDLSAGVFMELNQRGQQVMRWRPETGVGRGQVGALFVDWGAPLPPLQARALTLCSGITPRYSSAAKTAIYINVPQHLAQAVATSLCQRLQQAL